MIIYITTFDFENIKKGTRLKFNRNVECFETLDCNKNRITNDQSFQNPYLIKILKSVTLKSEVKKEINIYKNHDYTKNHR